MDSLYIKNSHVAEPKEKLKYGQSNLINKKWFFKVLRKNKYLHLIQKHIC